MENNYKLTEEDKKIADALRDLLKSKAFWDRLTKPKPKWMPFFVWKFVVKLVLR